MEAKELRIGNYVSYNNQICEAFVIAENVCQIKGKDMSFISGSPIKYKYIESIPLTLEWLLKLGFKAMEEGEYTYDAYSNGGIQIWHQDKKKLVIEKPSVSYHLQYVHQLQNLSLL